MSRKGLFTFQEGEGEGREGGERAKVKGEEDERERRGEIGKIVEV